MKPQIIFKFFIVLLLFISTATHAQYVQKRAGVCFRVDDNHLKQEFQQYASIFDTYGYKFCFALNLGLINPLDTGLLNTVDTLIAHGHEMMDHTPNHITKYFTVRSLTDTVLYSMSPGVDHFNQTKVCLKIDSIRTNSYGDEGPIVINGNRVISVLPGEFKNFGDGSLQCIYLPAINKLCAFYLIYNKNVNDPDTIYLKTYWDEPFTFPNTTTTTYKKIGLTDVFLSKSAIFNLFSQTTKYSNEFHFPPPTTWIQPGGYHPRLSQNQIKGACDLVGYNAAGINLDPAKKCFDEYNPYKTRRFSFQGEDFSSETQTFKTIKTRIADGIAKNKVQMEINHFGYYAPSSLLGGWSGYIQRMDSILSWCHVKNILVENYRYWVPLLYDNIPNPYQNVFPSLSIDLDEDTYPDGFNKTNSGTMLSSGGVQSSNGYYINIPVSGYLCSISSLGGIEKGINHLEFYTQGGNTNNSLYVRISYDQSNISETYEFPANSSFWKKQKIDFNCPDSISTISVTFSSFNVNSNVKLSGITLRKKSIISALPDTTIFTTFDSKFKTASLKERVYDPLFSKDSLSFSVVKTTGLITSIDSLKNLIVSKPTPFWKGTDTAWVKVQNPDGDDDTLRVIFKAISPVFCKGDTIILKPFFQITPSQITISSTPSDSTLIPKSFGVFSDVLNQTTRYFVKGIMPLGNIVSDSIDITIVAMQQPILSIIGNNPFCPADSIQILASPNNYKTNWYCNDLLIPENDSLANYRTSKSGDYYAIQYDQNGCKNNSAILTIEKYLKLEYNINADTTVCINIDSLQLFSQFTNSKSVSWTASGDGMLTILPNQNLIYHPGTSDRTNGSTFLSVIAEGVGSCSIVTDTIKIFFTPIPSKPSIPLGLDSLCINSPNSVFTCNGGTNAIYSEWAITPENAGAINNSSISYALIDWNNSFSGKAFLSVRAVNQCGMSNSSDTLAVKIIPIPGKADLPIGPSQICQNSPDQTFTTFGTPNASHYQWSILPANAANFSGNDNSIITHWNNGFTGTATITVKGINNCGIGAISDTFNLSVNPLPTKPGIPLGQTQLCVNSNNSFYTTLGSNYASIYQWNIYPEIAGVIIDSSTTSLVDWNNNFSGIAKLTVKGINECGSKISDSLTIKIDSLPEKPSIPSGLGILCNNSTNTTYSTIANPFINIYNWSIYPTNAGIINNFGATTLVNWNNNFSGPAFISVSAVNQCGTSNSSDTLSVNIIPIPGKADIPTGLSQICQNSNDQIFTTLETPSASHYQWNIIPANAANLTGNSNNTVAHFNSGFIGAAAITVQGVNNCGIGAVSDTFNLNIKPLPTKPSIPLGQTQLCINSNNSFYTTSGSNYASAYQWNIFPETAGVIIDSASTSFINWDSSFFGISKLIVKGTNECGSKSSDTLTIKIDPLPSKPSIPSGLEVLCNNTANVSYSTIAIPYTNSYNWNIYPTNAGSINNFGTNAIVNWNNYFTGLANISVKAINNCGISEASDSLAITVNSRPSNPIITNGPVSVKTDTTLFSSYTAYSIFSDSIIWWVEPSEAATLIPFNSNCDVYWNSNYSGNAQLKLKAKNDCGYSDSTVVFNVIILTAIGIENHLEMNLTVFPNPSSSGKFIIRFNQRQILKNTLIKITDQLGRIVFEKDIHPTELIGKSIEANISAFSKGIYFLSIGEKTRKIIFE